MNKTHTEFETATVSPQDIQNAIVRARRLQSEETARLLRAAGGKLHRLVNAALHLRLPVGGSARPLAH